MTWQVFNINAIDYGPPTSLYAGVDALGQVSNQHEMFTHHLR